MKNKKNLWILAPLVLVIWGIIAYRIIKTVKGNQQTISSLPSYPDHKPTGKEDTSSFTLRLDYDDPFLKGRTAIAAATTPAKPKTKAAKPRKTIQKSRDIPLVWPAIFYRGVIERKSAKSALHLIEVNGQSLMMRKGETIRDLKLLEAYGDSVKLEYQEKEKRNFRKQ